MSADLSTQQPNGHVSRMADALLRASGGTTAYLQMPTQPGDSTDAGQLGLDPPNFQPLGLSPVTMRRMKRVMMEGQPQEYELLVSESAVAAAVGEMQVASAELLFQMAAGVVVAGELFLIESVSISDLSVLKNQMSTLLGDGNSGRIAAIEGRVEQHERSLQRAKGFAVAMSAIFTLVQCMLEVLWRR